MSDQTVQNMSNGEKDPLDPYEMEARKRAQIERNNEWIEKMSPVVKYKEYIRKQKAKKMQRRKFSLACGLGQHRIKQEPSISISSSSLKRRSKKNAEASSKNRNSSVPALERNLSQPETTSSGSRKSASVSNRRKSAPTQKMDMRDLDDLE